MQASQDSLLTTILVPTSIASRNVYKVTSQFGYSSSRVFVLLSARGNNSGEVAGGGKREMGSYSRDRISAIVKIPKNPIMENVDNYF